MPVEQEEIYEKVQYLLQYENAKREEKLIKERIDKMQMDKLFPSATVNGMPRAYSKSDLSDIFVLEEKLNEELREKHLKSIKLRMEIEKKLQNMDSAKEREVLERYYLDGLTWKKVAKKIGYGEAQIYRLRNTALKNFKI